MKELAFYDGRIIDPVVRIGSATIGSGKPGPLFEQLYRAYGRFVASA